MTEDTSVELKPTSPTDSDKFPVITEWRLRLMTGAHISEFMPIILETILASLPPHEKENPILRANISGALVDGRVQVWGILGKVQDTNQWRPIGYMTTAIRPDELTGKSTLLIYTMFSFGVISDAAYTGFNSVLVDYAKEQGCAKLALFTSNARVIKMTQRQGWDTDWRFVFRDLE
ncbi:hypothetical protein LCGC14_1712510 [marine sediment metagenome]|uniref:N-acetyltransferase domain-containing protein n=1 Tax=marine sediment metagenome TaxID=412755 RepID=A0A0F9I274_9ZZZZ